MVLEVRSVRGRSFYSCDPGDVLCFDLIRESKYFLCTFQICANMSHSHIVIPRLRHYLTRKILHSKEEKKLEQRSSLLLLSPTSVRIQ